MTRSLLGPQARDLCTLQYIVTHVFLPLRLPEGDDHSIRNDHLLAGAVASAARVYSDSDRVDQVNVAQWHRISRMLDNLQATVQFESLDRSKTVSQLSGMDAGGKFSSLHCI